jgi:hypothetical protein
MLGVAPMAVAQEGTTIPDSYRGTPQAVARGVLNGNMIETNYRNHGELARWDDRPWGVWPKEIGDSHIDGVAVVVGGLVKGERAKWAGPPHNFWPAGTKDTLINPVSLNYRSAGIRTSPQGEVWGWLPLPGFNNPMRRNPITGAAEPVPAISTDPTSWPDFWPDKLQEEDSGWRGQWNGMFGRGVFQADQESFYVMDDLRNHQYHLNRVTRRPNSQHGIFYASPQDSSMGGLGLQVNVRLLQWANILAENTMFLIYRITNKSQTNYGECLHFEGRRPPNALRQDECGSDVKSGLMFTQYVDYGLGELEDNGWAAFNPVLDVAYGWDPSGIGLRRRGQAGTYRLGYVGFAFLESPANDRDGLDNDRDGITDEKRFGGPGVRIVGQENIRNEMLARGYDLGRFEAFYGALETRSAYRVGIWWTGDENLNWVGFSDLNGNGRWDDGEPLNDDVGRDGLGPFDPNYPGRDMGEADGIPTAGEPNFDQLDVNESDQIGLTGFHLSTRQFYESGNNLREDHWMWARIRDSQFGLEQPPAQFIAQVEPFLNFSSGLVNLGPNQTDFFSTAWIFGLDEREFFENRQTVQQIYNASYRFAEPPIVPTLRAEAGDGYVVLSWDTLSVMSFDRFTQRFDFEGYKLYKGTDPLLSDSRLVTDVFGTPRFHRPIAQWDLKNNIRGNVPILNNTLMYNLGSETGLQFSYIDRDVVNGKTYYYAIVAYDHGFVAGPDDIDPNAPAIDPQENTFNIRARTRNTAVVTPRSRAAGFRDAGTREDLSRVTSGLGTGSISVDVVNQLDLRDDVVYRMNFFDDRVASRDVYDTVDYELRNHTTNEVIIPRTRMVTSTPVVDGFVVNLFNDRTANDDERTGWMATTLEGDQFFSRTNPRSLPGYETTWTLRIRADTTSRYTVSPYEYTVRWADSLYTTPQRDFGGYLASRRIPLWCHNETLNRRCEIFVYDSQRNGDVDYFGDWFVIADQVGLIYRFRHQFRFVPVGGDIAPKPGDRFFFGTQRPFATGDYFQFSMRRAEVDGQLAQEELRRITVVPNPYVAAAEWEPRFQGEGRGDRMLKFSRLPERCTIRIYTIRGELVRTIEHEGVAGGGDAWWDLRSADNQEVAYGIYLYHVLAPGIGETTGKFAIIK